MLIDCLKGLSTCPRILDRMKLGISLLLSIVCQNFCSNWNVTIFLGTAFFWHHLVSLFSLMIFISHFVSNYSWQSFLIHQIRTLWEIIWFIGLLFYIICLVYLVVVECGRRGWKLGLFSLIIVLVFCKIDGFLSSKTLLAHFPQRQLKSDSRLKEISVTSWLIPPPSWSFCYYVDVGITH